MRGEPRVDPSGGTLAAIPAHRGADRYRDRPLRWRAQELQDRSTGPPRRGSRARRRRPPRTASPAGSLAPTAMAAAADRRTAARAPAGRRRPRGCPAAGPAPDERGASAPAQADPQVRRRPGRRPGPTPAPRSRPGPPGRRRRSGRSERKPPWSRRATATASAGIRSHVGVEADLAKEGAVGLRDRLGAHRHHARAAVAVGQRREPAHERAAGCARRARATVSQRRRSPGNSSRERRRDVPGCASRRRTRRGSRARCRDAGPARAAPAPRGLPAVADQAIAHDAAASGQLDHRAGGDAVQRARRGRRGHRRRGSSSGGGGPGGAVAACAPLTATAANCTAGG